MANLGRSHCPPTGLKALATSDFALDCDATGVHSRIWTCPAFLASQGDKRFMRRGFVVVAGFYAVCSWSLVAVSRSLDRAAADNTGLIQSFYTGSADTPQVRRHVREIDPLILDQAADAGVRSFRIKWEGVWYFPGDAQLYLDAWADDRVLLRVDGKLVIEHDISREVEPVRRRLALTKGFHDLEVVYEQRDGEYALNIQWAPVGQPFRPITPERLFPTASLEPVQRALAFRRVRARVLGRPSDAVVAGVHSADGHAGGGPSPCPIQLDTPGDAVAARHRHPRERGPGNRGPCSLLGHRLWVTSHQVAAGRRVSY